MRVTVENLIEDAFTLAVVDLQHVCAAEVFLQSFTLDLDKHGAILHGLVVGARLHDLQQAYFYTKWVMFNSVWENINNGLFHGNVPAAYWTCRHRRQWP